ncbi:transposable element Tcb2 transposase [Trichonephila clavipes]|nr:transposable element Tcb2 transposase [Trichonephila clavipes]
MDFQSSEKFCHLLRCVLDVMCQILEISDSSEMSKNAEEMLCYMKSVMVMESSSAVRCVRQKLLGAVDTRRYPRAKNRVWSLKEDHALVDPTVTRSTIRADVGVAIVPQTISRHLSEANLKSQPPFRALPLTPEHRQLRLQWCQDRSMWNVTDWQNVVFSDAFRFVMGTDDNHVRVWRRPGERYNSPHTVLHDTVRTAGVMVWGAIAYDSRSTLIEMRGTLTGQCYVDDILRPHTLPWPARSPNLSPVEHMWNQLKRQMTLCPSVHDLELAVQDLSAHLPQDNIRCLINSMPVCVAACIAAGGCPTRY